MFCPNCGTQNPDTAQTCSKCNFQLKSAAAPKFKGTMLMMNQPGAAPAPPPPPGVPGPQGAPPPGPGGAPPGAPRPVGAVGPAPGAVNRLKGTMVGVAPPVGGMAGNAPPPGPVPGAIGGGGFPPPTPPVQPMQQATQPSAAMPMPGATPAPGMPPMAGHEASAFSPPIPQAGVNPLGGTVAADAAAFGSAFGPPQGQGPGASPYGPPPQGAMPYGPPQGAPPGYGAPPPGPYGSPPQQGYGPNPYGPPPQQGYGPPMGGMGPGPGMAPGPMGPGPMAPYGQPGPMAPQGVGIGTLQSAGVGAGPRKRNALLVLLLPVAIMFGGMFVFILLAALTGVPALGALAFLAYLGGLGLFLFNTIQMANELKAVTRSPAFAWWPIFVPFYNWYWLWILVPQEVAKAKQMLGVQAPVRSIVLYIFLWPFALASDINDMAR